MMHTAAIKKYMTETNVTYELEPWDSNPEIYWLKRINKYGQMINCTIIYDIHALYSHLEAWD